MSVASRFPYCKHTRPWSGQNPARPLPRCSITTHNDRYPPLFANRCAGALASLVAFVLLLTGSLARAQSLQPEFVPLPNGPVRALAVQADGQVLVGGDFTMIAGQNRRALARLDAVGNVDPTFDPVIGVGQVHAIVVQPDGRILIGGSFTQVGVSARARIARLNADGSLDASFNPGANGLVRTLLLEANGAIIAGGDFTQFGNQSRGRLARVSAGGLLDAGFQPNPSGTVYALDRLPDGRIWVGGDFALIGGLSRTHLARLLATGEVDLTFMRMANNVVRAIVADIDDTTLLGGEFTSLPSVNAGGLPLNRSRLVRIRNSGALASGISSSVNGPVHALLVRPDGDVVATGDFTQVNGELRNRYVRLSAGGDLRPPLTYTQYLGHGLALAVDPVGRVLLGGSWSSEPPGYLGGSPYLLRTDDHVGVERVYVNNADADDWVMALASRADGRQAVGGRFQTVGGASRLRGALLSRWGAQWDAGLALGSAPVGVHAVTFANNGNVLFGGSFLQAGNADRRNFADFGADGGLRFANPAPNAPLWAMAVQEDGQILVAGAFTTIHGQARKNIARLQDDQLLPLDASFNVAINAVFPTIIHAIALQTDGKILIAGDFTNVSGLARSRIARLHSDGSVDTSFLASFNAVVLTLAVQADGRVLVGGEFSTVNGVSRPFLARVHPDGSTDTSFTASANMPVRAIAPLVDGRILVGGDFTTFNGAAHNRLLRLFPDGSRDSSFNLPTNDAVYSLLVHPEGHFMVGGNFTTLAGQPRARLARLGEPEPVRSALVVEGGSVIWRRAGPGPEVVQRPLLQFSSDGINYAPMASMERIPGGWAVSGFEPPIGQTYYLRLRARPGSGATSVFEVTSRLQGPSDLIMANGFEP